MKVRNAGLLLLLGWWTTTNEQAAGCGLRNSFHLLQMEGVCLFKSRMKPLILKLKWNYGVPAGSRLLDIKRKSAGNLIKGKLLMK